MKTRIVQTSFHSDPRVELLGKDAKWLFMYCLTCQYIGLTGAFQLSDKKLMFETGLTPKELKKAKVELQNIVVFTNDWIVVLNSEKHNRFSKSKKTKVAYDRELEALPEEIQDVLSGKLDTVSEKDNTVSKKTNTVQTISDSPRNHKSETINHKQEIALRVIKKFNEVFGTKYSSPRSIQSNLAYWLEVYSLEDVFEAIEQGKKHHYWKNKLTPDILFRRKNPRGEDCDRVGELKNYIPEMKKKKAKKTRSVPKLPELTEEQREKNREAIEQMKKDHNLS